MTRNVTPREPRLLPEVRVDRLDVPTFRPGGEGDAAGDSQQPPPRQPPHSTGGRPTDEREPACHRAHFAPKDTGWAWVIVFGCFLVQLIMVGVAKSFGILFVEFLEYFDSPAGSATWIMSLNAMVTFLLGPFATSLGLMWSSRVMLLAGGLLFSAGFVLSALARSIETLYLTYGLVVGLAFACSYAPSIVIVSEYFDRRRALANGIAVAGAGMGNLVLPLLTRHLLDHWGLSGTLILLGGLGLHVCVSGMLTRPTSFYTRCRLGRRGSDPRGSLAREGHPVVSESASNGAPGVRRLAEGGRPRTYSSPLPAIIGDHGRPVSCDDLTVGKMVAMTTAANGHSSCDNVAMVTRRHAGCARSPRDARALYDGIGDGVYSSLRSLRDDVTRCEGAAGGFLTSRRRCYTAVGRDEEGVGEAPLPPPTKGVGRCGALYSRLCYLPPTNTGFRRPVFDWLLLREPLFVLYTASLFFSSMGYSVLLMVLPAHMAQRGLHKTHAALVISIIGGADLLGRVFFGWLADLDLVKKRWWYVVGMLVSGLSCLLAPLAASRGALVAVALFLGLFGGAWVALIPVMLVEALGLDRLPNSFGLSLVAQGVSMLVGFSLVGYLRDLYGTWDVGLYICGATLVMGAAIVLLEPLVAKATPRQPDDDVTMEVNA